MDNNKKYGQFDRLTLLKYLKGGLSPEDTWKVEKAMQDDPFLAEAMEGLEAAERFGVLTEDLEWLRGRIKKRRHRVKVLELPNLLNVAAVLLIVLVSAWLVIEIARNNGQTKNEIAMQKAVKQHDTTSTSAYNDAGIKQEKENTILPTPSVSNVKKKAKTGENNTDLNNAKNTEPLKTFAEEESKPNAGAGSIVAADDISVDKNNKTEQRPAKLEDMTSISANSTDEKVEASREMSVGEGIPEKRVEGKKTARTGKLVEAYMERSYAVNTAAYTESQPALGDSSYNEYVIKSLRYPETARISNTEGVVFLQFTVAVDSTIQDIKIISGPGNGCREEAVRLLKEGPKWIPATSYGKPVKSQAVFKVDFSINK